MIIYSFLFIRITETDLLEHTLNSTQCVQCIAATKGQYFYHSLLSDRFE